MTSNQNNQFVNYPEPREGPLAPYQNETQSIPVFRGIPLVIGATLIHNIGFIQSHFWKNAGFDVIHDIPQLKQYSARYDPTVIPVRRDHTETVTDPPAPETKRQGKNGYYTSADYHAFYKAAELSPVDVVETLLSLIRRDAQPPGKHSVAFLESKVDAIRAAAEASAGRYKNGKPLGPLDGVPVVVKDEVHVKGYDRTLGTKMDFKNGLEGTSWCVRKWEEVGAIVIGKTTMHELGLDTNNNNPNYGTPRNPHNRDYYCGGSSGGSAYAVGTGLVPIALGADGGGSIRIPSSFCGLWGLKPSHSRVSAAPTLGLAPTVGVYGPMATSIDDLAHSYRIMAAPPPASEDSNSSAFPPQNTPIDTNKTKKIGLVRDWIDRAEPPVRAAFDNALAYYKKQGYETIDIHIPYLPEGQRAHVLTIMSEIASGLEPKRQIKHLTAPNKVLMSVAAWQILSADFLAAQRLRSLLMSHLAHLFQTHPGLLIFTPTTPIPGWRIDGGESDLAHGLSDGKSSVRNMEYVWLANYTGCPAISCPGGYSDDGVPMGIMAMGEWGAEEELIAFARDGESLLESLPESLAPASAKDGDKEGKGLRVPGGENGFWEDVIARAGEKA
ncbi:amidase [Aspergillus ruber CBS 135680]|uniref:Amidase signature enzyme n=1 Tax=Aspergillus ruber (strain CBS 135680) TaxID=1388766 RepID=A0A017SR86_ASPRC|nr:amidase signature enzyme [Aspergillus ruber CBS 135680]EYE99059.1 amidase signature enzyme [Aspergillus ruber CBS 135680]